MATVLEKLRRVARDTRHELRMRGARRAFDAAGDAPAWLDRSSLERLQRQYKDPSNYGYGPEVVMARGQERAREILDLPVPDSEVYTSFLELGCFDGMVCAALQQQGKRATATDLSPEGFDERLESAGVAHFAMDAADLQFEDDSFDFVFSYDAFEHISDPAAALREALRVCRPGGSIFLVFGPLYMSPYGLHAYQYVPVPYCHLLFPDEMILEVAGSLSSEEPNIPYVNGWPVTRYRQLWKGIASQVDVLIYDEHRHTADCDLIKKYPSCFKSKTEEFDDLIVSSIRILLRKRSRVPPLQGGEG